ncbi:MAG: hypothetical protein Fur0010_21720 [Bdellovibrio sp.]
MATDHKRKKAKKREEEKARKKHLAQTKKAEGLKPEEKKFGQMQILIVMAIAIVGSGAILYLLS